MLAERPFILHALAAHGVLARHRDDVLQLVVLGAWRACEAGRYRPDPSVSSLRAMRAWLYSLCWRHTAHHRELAWVRREAPSADPWIAADEPAVDGDAAMVFADLARLLRGFPKYLRPVVALAADGHGVVEIAHRLGITFGTASNRLRRARDLVADRLGCERRRP